MLYVSRKGINPIVDSLTFIHIIYYLLKIKPFCCFPFTIKPVVYSLFATRILNIKNIPMITGLGTGFLEGGWLTIVVKMMYKFSLSGSNYIFFQNDNDLNLFNNLKLVDKKKCQLTPGSGIDLQKFIFCKKDNNYSPFIFLLVARLVWDKGLKEYIKAANKLHDEYPKAQFHIVGPSGVQNRTAIPSSEIDKWREDGVVSYLGEVEDVREKIKEATCIVLPSYREGTSRVLLEASAIGRPIIATNVPGCKEVVLDHKSGFLCKVKSSHDLYLKMKKMYLLDSDTRNEMGSIGRKHVENKFNHKLVCQIYLDALTKLSSEI